MIRVDETDPVGEIEPSFPYRDVTVRRGAVFKDHYDIQSELGRGKFGTVYRCREKTSGLMLAAKVVNTSKKEDRRAVEREVEIMRRLQHPRLIQLYDAIDTGKQIYVILELIDGGELFERVIDDDFILTERSCAVFMRQICEGVEFIHKQKILHLDLKPENILCLTKEGNRIKIIDFGLAREYDPNKKLQVLFGTPEFVAPEVVNFDQIGFGTDMWSIGVICYVLLSGLSPFMGDTDIETMANVTVAKYDFDHEAFNEISDDAKDFIRCLLVKDKEKRLTATQSRQHRWLSRKPSRPAISNKFLEPGYQQHLRPYSNGTLNNNDELDLTKDNLRLFVERWREHPDSPYILDLPYNILPKQAVSVDHDEMTSVRAQSPSPCESIASSFSENTDSSPRDAQGLLTVPSISLTFERRASEGAAKDKFRDPASQIILAEEIIRLSEHLRSIAASSDAVTAETENPETVKTESTKRPEAREKRRNSRNVSFETTECNEIAEKLSNITRQRKLNGTTFHSSRSFDRSETSTNLFANLKKTKIDEERSREKSETKSALLNSRDKKLEGRINEAGVLGRNLENEMDLTPPWRRPRVKHQFGETSRDVPRISNLRDLHKTLNLDEPSNTKDLLIHLLGEWEECGHRQLGAGRKSVSVDWCHESLARKTMNSLAEYFQAKQQKSTSVEASASSSYR